MEKPNVELYLKEMGQRIMERRKKLGLTQEALAELSKLQKEADFMSGKVTQFMKTQKYRFDFGADGKLYTTKVGRTGFPSELSMV